MAEESRRIVTINGNTLEVNVVDNSEEVVLVKNQAIERALEKCGLVAERYAKENCPVRTGRLRNSISHATEAHAATGKEYIGTNVEYGPYVELGARGRQPKHFLKKAAQNHGDEYKGIFKRELQG